MHYDFKRIIGKKKNNPNRLNRDHYLIIISLCSLIAASYGLVMNSGNIFVASVTEDLNIGQGTFAISLTILSLTNAFMSLFIPKLMDIFGIKKIIVFGTILLGISTISLSIINSFKSLFFLSIFRGIGMSLIGTVPVLLIINNWFIKYNGKISSIVLITSGVVGAIFSPIFARIILDYGWRNAYVIMGLLIILFPSISLILDIKSNPEDKGLKPYGAEEEDKKIIISGPKDFDRYQLFVFTIYFSTIYAMQNLQTYYSGYANSLGFSIEISGMMLSLAMICNILSKVVLGNLSEKIGKVKASIFMIIINIIAIVLLIFPLNSYVIILGGGLYGSIFSLSVIGTSILTLRFFGRVNYAYVYPKLSFIASLFSSLTNPLIGYVFDFTQSLLSILITFLILQIINIIIILFLEKNIGGSIGD